MSIRWKLARRSHQALITAGLLWGGLLMVEPLAGETAVTPAMRYFSRGSAQQSVYYGPAPQAAPVTQASSTSTDKPFDYVQRGSTITPYVNLDLLESTTGIPNYYTFVKPRLEERERLEAQARELQRLHRQARLQGQKLQTSVSPSGSPYRDLKSYYPALNR